MTLYFADAAYRTTREDYRNYSARAIVSRAAFIHASLEYKQTLCKVRSSTVRNGINATMINS